MTLSERLAAARRARLRDAGPPAEEQPVQPVEAAPPVPRHDVGPAVIEVAAAPGPHPVVEAPDEPLGEGCCPTCRTEGVIDMVDLVGHTTHFSCPNCGTLWQLSRRRG